MRTSAADFKAFADVLEKAGKNGIVKILGGRNAFEEAYSSEGMPSLVKVL